MFQFFRNFFKTKLGLAISLAFLGLIALAFASADVSSTGTFGGIEAATDALFESIACGDAQFGDLAGVITPEGDFHLALVAGAVLLAPGELRLERSPRADMVRAWRAAPAGDAR